MVHADGLDFLQHVEHRRTHIYIVIGQSSSIKYVHFFCFGYQGYGVFAISSYFSISKRKRVEWILINLLTTKVYRISECNLFCEAHKNCLYCFQIVLLNKFQWIYLWKKTKPDYLKWYLCFNFRYMCQIKNCSIEF